MMKGIVVSVCCMTYNHKNYIRQCLDGFVMQQTDFQFEILVHDDASTDGTDLIVKEYEQRYPHLFRNVYQTENQFEKQNTLVNILFKMARGKYIALCEGDDYWTDPLKLQKQVDFLEQNPDCTGIHTKVMYVDKYNNIQGYSDRVKPEFEEIDFEALIQGNIIHTCSFVFRKDTLFYDGKFLWELTPSFHDIYLFLGVSLKGKIKYLDEVTSVYRKNVGIYQTFTKERRHREALNYHNFYLQLNQAKPNNKASILYSMLNRIIELILILLKQRRRKESVVFLKSLVSTYNNFLSVKKHLRYRRIKFSVNRYSKVILWLLFTNIMYHSSRIYNRLYYVSHRRNRPGA